MSDWLTWQLVDSAFPTGLFAHSWGLESAWQHGEVEGTDALRAFVEQTVVQAGFAALPLLNSGYRGEPPLERLDAIADAFLVNAVANRASRVQGRTLLATVRRIWPSPGVLALESRVRSMCGHVAPLSGAVFRAMDVPLETAQRAVLYGTARGVLTAAVRLGIAGTYESQRLQHASAPALDRVLERCQKLSVDDLAQTAPVIDLLQSAHDRLYSRLFQS